MSDEKQICGSMLGRQGETCQRRSGPGWSTLLLALTLTLVGVTPTAATVLQPLTLEALTHHADVVLHGQVESVQTVLHGRERMPVTMARISVLEVLAGSLPPRRQIMVTQPGGTADGVALEYAGRPHFTAGRQAVFFLARRGPGQFIIVGLAQGKYEVSEADAQGHRKLTRNLHGAAFATPASEVLPDHLEELRRRIRGLPRDLTGVKP
jgi:hypothetical protein